MTATATATAAARRRRIAAPRTHCIAASAAPVRAVFRRRPSYGSQLGRWDTERDVCQPGAGLRERLFARRSDL